MPPEPSGSDFLQPALAVNSHDKGQTTTPPFLVEHRENGAYQTALVQLRQQVQLYELINHINNEIRSTLNLEEVLNLACRLLGQAVGCSRVSILILESDEPDVFVSRGEYSQAGYATQLGLPIPVAGNTHLQTLITQPGVLPVTRFLDFPGLNEATRDLAEHLSIRSMLAMATWYQGRVNGVIGLHQCDRERDWTRWEQQLLEGVGNQLAIAISQARLYSEARRQAEQESLLRLVTNQIRSSLDLDTILKTVVGEVRRLLKTDRVVVYQFFENWQGTVVVEDVVSPWCSVLGEMGQDNCFSGEYAELYQSGRVRAIHNILEAGLDKCHMHFLQRLQVQANLIVPIVIGKRLWGLLLAQECRSPRFWQVWETELLRQLGDQAAIAIQQAELYAQVRHAASTSQAQTQQLQEALDELKSTQLQLIQTEKLSSLGQMVAGIAHEMNNATNFIHANLPYAQEYAETLRQAVLAYKAQMPQPPDAIAQLSDKVDLDFVCQDFPKLLKSMQTGTERIREVVSTLRNFARLDEAEHKPVDLHEGIESSLVILQHRIRAGVQLHKRYGKLPLVTCHAGQINQVFLNLLSNALDAMTDHPHLTIKTWVTKTHSVIVSIKDNGVGIPPDIQPRIFDPFFTTKPIGQGTGLGLSICYQIVVEGHQGQIRCSSSAKGTEFQVELPLTTSFPT